MGQADMMDQHIPKSFQRICGLFDGFVDIQKEVITARLDNVEKQIFLILEVIVSGGDTHVQRMGNIPHRSPGIAFFPKKVGSHIDNLLPLHQRSLLHFLSSLCPFPLPVGPFLTGVRR
jgi:hypothetical protein